MKPVMLRFNYEFSRVYKRGSFAIGKYLTIHCFKRYAGLKHNNTKIPTDINRLGFCANKKQLGAVERNRARRLLREAYRSLADRIPEGYDIVFTLRPLDELPTYQQLSEEMKKLLIKLHIFDSNFDSKLDS